MKLNIFARLARLGAVGGAFALILTVLTGCGGGQTTQFQVYAGIRPVAALATALLQNTPYQVGTLLPDDKNVHDFDPGYRDIAKLRNIRIYFGCGLPLDETAVAQLADRCTVVNLGEVEAGGHAEKSGHHHHTAGLHWWTSLPECGEKAEIMAAKLQKVFPDRQSVIAQNLAALLDLLKRTDMECRKILAPYAGRSFVIYHPAFGPFADAYKLKQQAIEQDGHEPSLKYLQQLAQLCKQEKLRKLFVQNGFSPRPAQTVAAAAGLDIEDLNPMCTFMELKAVALKIKSGF